MERVSTGVAMLDYVLDGGIPEGSTVLVVGRPGSGKTILAHQMMFHNAAPDFKTLYLTTLGEPQVNVLKYQQEFAFFATERIQSSVIYFDLGSPLRKKGCLQVMGLIDNMIKQHQPRLVIIDTIKTLSEMIGSFTEVREFILDLTLRLNLWGCTTLLLGEYSEEDIEVRPESAIADGIILLSGTEERRQQRRYLRILKMRGTDYLSGENIFTISQEGIELFPRLNPLVNTQTYNPEKYRIPTGIPSLDEMMGGGIPAGTATLISGSAGSGKTILAVYSAYANLKLGNNVVYVTFEENPQQLVRNMEGLGIELQSYIDNGQLYIDHVSPIEISIDEHIHHIQKLVGLLAAKQLVIDSISSFEVGMTDKFKYTDYIWTLCDYMKTLGINIVLTSETPFNDLNELTKYGISYIADNQIIIRYVERGTAMKRFLQIIKMRGCQHSQEMRDLIISTEGILL